MPERPDLHYVIDVLRKRVVGHTITAVELRNPVVLRQALPGRLDERLVGRAIVSITRQAHFVRFALSAEPAAELVISPMLAGRFDLVDSKARLRADTALVLDLEGGERLLYRDDKQMGKVYLISAGDTSKVPGLEPIGVDVLDGRRFTRATFRRLAKGRRDQVRVFLMDKRALDALGNAYADEVLFAAKIHPKAWTRSLSETQLDVLHDAIIEVLKSADKEIARRKPPLAEKVRDFLQVRGKAGQPCPRCNTKLRKVRVKNSDAHFCPQCQVDDRGSSLVSWRKLPPRG